jgi:hypothetical protein
VPDWRRYKTLVIDAENPEAADVLHLGIGSTTAGMAAFTPTDSTGCSTSAPRSGASSGFRSTKSIVRRATA